MKKALIISGLLAIISASAVTSCKTPQKIASRSGAQLWSENCLRCHNAPPPNAFDREKWEVIGTHMKLIAGLTETEKEKIVSFLKSSN